MSYSFATISFNFFLCIGDGETRTRVDFCKVTHREGKRLHIIVELELKHPILFIACLYFGAGLFMMLLGCFYGLCS